MGDTIRWATFTFFLLGSTGGLIFLGIIVRKGIQSYLAYDRAMREWELVDEPVAHTPAPWAPRIVKPEGTVPARQRAAGEAQP